MRTVEQILSNHPYCPVCKSRDRVRFNLKNTSVRDSSNGSNYYLDILFKSAGIDVASALERMTLWECKACQTLWYDPWLTLDFIASSYGYLTGRHKQGWERLRTYSGNYSRRSERRIVDLLLALLPDFSRYAEVNCPFNGILLELQNRRVPNFDKTKAVLAKKNGCLAQDVRVKFASGELHRSRKMEPVDEPPTPRTAGRARAGLNRGSIADVLGTIL